MRLSLKAGFISEAEVSMKEASKHHKRLLITAALTICSAMYAFASDVKIIANPGVRTGTISVDELKGVFLLKRRTLNDGTSAEPVLEKSGQSHEAFLKQYLNRDNEEIHVYYQGLVFTGKALMPKEFKTDADVVAYVSRTRGAIGYVGASADTSGVKVLEVTEGQAQTERQLLQRIEPTYPETLQRLRIGGVVRLEITISRKGLVESAVLLGGNPILGDAAIAAVKKWIYAPAPSRSTTEITLQFNPQP
jgi:TonB family protein